MAIIADRKRKEEARAPYFEYFDYVPNGSKEPYKGK